MIHNLLPHHSCQPIITSNSKLRESFLPKRVIGLELRQRKTEPQRSYMKEIDKHLADWLLAERADRDESACLALIFFQDRSARAIAQAKLKEEEFEKLGSSAALYESHQKQEEQEQTPMQSIVGNLTQYPGPER